MARRAAISFLFLALAVPATPAAAQVKPASSGARSFNAPEMRRYGSGFYRPNQPGQVDTPLAARREGMSWGTSRP